MKQESETEAQRELNRFESPLASKALDTSGTLSQLDVTQKLNLSENWICLPSLALVLLPKEDPLLKLA